MRENEHTAAFLYYEQKIKKKFKEGIFIMWVVGNCGALFWELRITTTTTQNKQKKKKKTKKTKKYKQKQTKTK